MTKPKRQRNVLKKVKGRILRPKQGMGKDLGRVENYHQGRLYVIIMVALVSIWVVPLTHLQSYLVVVVQPKPVKG